MTHILVTGGRGVLGTAITSEATAAGDTIRIMSRRPAPATLAPRTEWAQADVLTGEGLEQAVKGVDVIIHGATSAQKDAQATEVEGTRKVLAAARAAGVEHVIYASIVGIEHFPRFPYYRHKCEAEAVIQLSDVPYTILRATQFHTLIEMFLEMMFKPPIGLVASDWQFQSIAPLDAARAFVAAAHQAPGGMLPDVGGPEVLKLGDMARAWLAARGAHRLWLPLRGLPMFPDSDKFRNGYNTCPERRVGTQTWREWLQERYPMVEAHESRGQLHHA